jgi:STE24 endopeptidase
MQFLVLLLLMLVCVPVDRPEPPEWLGTTGCAALTWAGIGLIVASAAAVSQWTRYRLRHDPWQRDAYQHRYSGFRFYHLIGLFAVYGLTLYVFGWGGVVQEACEVGPPEARWPLPGMELLILAPFLVGLVLSWTCFYDAERALHDCGPYREDGHAFWSRWSYVGFHVRFNLVLVLVPVALLIVQEGFHRLLPTLHRQWLFQVASWGVLGLVFIGMPWVLRLVLGLQPMPECELRSRLDAAARRLSFRFSNILLWPTRGGVANAMVAGIVPWVRYVVLTDCLVEGLSDDELEAVFGHEVGHVKHLHMLYYLGFLLGSVLVVGAVWQMVGLEQILDVSLRQDLAVLPLFFTLGAYIFVVFGFLSRRCERQADIYGCRAVSCERPDCQGHDGTIALSGGRGLCPTGIRTFIDALEKVARLNGISRDRPGWLQSWLHSTIARRVAFLKRILEDPSVEPRFQRFVGLVKWAFVLVLLAVLGLLLMNGGTKTIL